MILLLVMTDGRKDCIAQAIPSALANLVGPITTKIIHDDSGDIEYRLWLEVMFPDFHIVATPGRQGFAGAYRSAWEWISTNATEPYVFSTEDDFTFNRNIPLMSLARVLDQESNLIQLALRRQPWNDQERAAGGIVEQHPDAYVDRSSVDDEWLEQRLFFTTNPSLYRMSLCSLTWPSGPYSEGRFSHDLLVDPAIRFGYWGARSSGEWCKHIGQDRNGTGY